MTAAKSPRRALPDQPSREHLRKQAKRLAKIKEIRLATAQRHLALEYGFANWSALMRAVDAASPAEARASSPLAEAAARGDAIAVRDLLAEGHTANGETGDDEPPLYLCCSGAAPPEQRLAVARLLLDAGASPRGTGKDGLTALHAAARTGPLALVEMLIRGGAPSWQPDQKGRAALEHARQGDAPDRDAIVELLDRPVMGDRQFRAAVRAIHAGDLDDLTRLLDAHPSLLRERAIEPDCYPRDYFRDPKLFWFIANNPTLMRNVPANIAGIAQVMIDRGVDTSDLDYTLELVITNGVEQMGGHQDELARLLIEAGATATPRAVVMALAHWSVGPVQALLDRGMTLTAPVAAALGRVADLKAFLPQASAPDVQVALGLAVINRQVAAARACLDAGADLNAFLPVHRHSTPLHQAAINDDLDMMDLLLDRRARTDIRDTLWDSTPLGWAMHGKHARAEGLLRARGQ